MRGHAPDGGPRAAVPQLSSTADSSCPVWRMRHLHPEHAKFGGIGVLREQARKENMFGYSDQKQRISSYFPAVIALA
jgi:hypothetical protein